MKQMANTKTIKTKDAVFAANMIQELLDAIVIYREGGKISLDNWTSMKADAEAAIDILKNK